MVQFKVPSSVLLNIQSSFAEKDHRVYQLPPGSGYEVRQILPWVQTDTQDPASGQG